MRHCQEATADKPTYGNIEPEGGTRDRGFPPARLTMPRSNMTGS